MVAQVPGTGHLGGDVHHRWDDLLPQRRLQPFGIVDTVLQAEQDRVLRQVRRDQLRGRFGVRRLHAEENQLGAGDPAGLVQADDVDAVIVGDVSGERTITARSPMQLFWRRLRRDKVAMTALVFIVLLVFIAIFSPLIVELAGVSGPLDQNSEALDVFGTPTGPSAEHPFGVDRLGRDIFAEILADVPDTWLEPVPGAGTPDRLRAAYVDFLDARLHTRQWLPAELAS